MSNWLTDSKIFYMALYPLQGRHAESKNVHKGNIQKGVRVFFFVGLAGYSEWWSSIKIKENG